MKRQRFLALAVILLAFTLIPAACSNDNDDFVPETLTYSGTKSGTAYTLTITQARYVAKAGDAYVLKITESGTTETSNGTVVSFSGNTFTLKPSNNGSSTFTTEVNGTAITAITGSIAIQGSSATVEGPGSFSESSDTAPAVSGVTVIPSIVSVAKGGTRSFSASVSGTGSPAQTVTWTVTGGVAGTIISTSGVLVVDAGETASTLTVQATSTVDTGKSGTAAVTVTETSTDQVYELHLDNSAINNYAIEARLTATQWANVTSPNSWDQVLRGVSQTVYTKVKDDFDFIFFILNSQNENNAVVNQLGFYGINMGVSNDIQGLGLNIYSNASSFGSGGKLKSIMFFPDYSGIKWGPALHEIAHNWAAFVCPTFDLIGDPCYAHWGVSNAGGQLGGFKYIREVSAPGTSPMEYQASMDDERNLDGSFVSGGFGEIANGGNGVPYSDIELYLMGMLSAQELRDENFRLDIYTGCDYDPSKFLVNEYGEHFIGYFSATGITSYTIDQLIALNGERVPDYSTSQKDFNVLTVILSDGNDTTSSSRHSDIVENVKWFAGESSISGFYNFNEATQGKGSLVVDGIQSSRK